MSDVLNDRWTDQTASSQWQEATSRVDALVAKAKEHAERMQALSGELEAIEVTGSAEGVAVTVGHTGALLDVRIDRGNSYPDQLEQAILAASRVAQQRLRTVVDEVVTEYAGAGTPTAEHFTEQYSRLFPDSGEEEGS